MLLGDVSGHDWASMAIFDGRRRREFISACGHYQGVIAVRRLREASMSYCACRVQRASGAERHRPAYAAQ